MPSLTMKERFRGYHPVVIDVETSGFSSKEHAILEIAAVPLVFEEDRLISGPLWHEHLLPFEGAVLDPKALAFNQIDPDHPLRFAISEAEAMARLQTWTRALLRQSQCQKAVLVGHNAAFDLGFLIEAAHRHQMKKFPFHRFTALDTASLSAVFLGHTVLAESCKRAGIDFSPGEAHSAIYDAQKTAELFCYMVNKLQVHTPHTSTPIQ